MKDFLIFFLPLVAFVITVIVLGGPILARRKERQLSESAAQWLRDNAQNQIEGIEFQKGWIEFSGSGSTDGRVRARTCESEPHSRVGCNSLDDTALKAVCETAGIKPGPLP